MDMKLDFSMTGVQILENILSLQSGKEIEDKRLKNKISILPAIFFW